MVKTSFQLSQPESKCLAIAGSLLLSGSVGRTFDVNLNKISSHYPRHKMNDLRSRCLFLPLYLQLWLVYLAQIRQLLPCLLTEGQAHSLHIVRQSTCSAWMSLAPLSAAQWMCINRCRRKLGTDRSKVASCIHQTGLITTKLELSND